MICHKMFHLCNHIEVDKMLHQELSDEYVLAVSFIASKNPNKALQQNLKYHNLIFISEINVKSYTI